MLGLWWVRAVARNDLGEPSGGVTMRNRERVYSLRRGSCGSEFTKLTVGIGTFWSSGEIRKPRGGLSSGRARS